MKLSLFQIIAIVCILAVGFLTVTPFLQEADASCGYYSESYCDSAVDYFVQKLNEAISTCNQHGQGSSECDSATQTAYNAKQWAEWVCAHADS